MTNEDRRCLLREAAFEAEDLARRWERRIIFFGKLELAQIAAKFYAQAARLRKLAMDL